MQLPTLLKCYLNLGDHFPKERHVIWSVLEAVTVELKIIMGQRSLPISPF